MIELGCLAGDPCLADTWTAEQRRKGLAYHHARTMRGDAPPSIAPMSRWDFVRLVEMWLEGWPGFARLVYQGAVAVMGGRRG